MIVFLSLALVGLFFLLVSTMFGDHTDTHAEVDAGHFGFLSVRLLAVFLTAFGTVGAIARWYDISAPMSSLWGLVAALPLSAVYALAMKALRSQQASSLVEDCDLVGMVGRVTVTIAPGAIGEVSCTVKAQTARRLARSLGQEALPEGAIVRVAAVQGDVVVVEPVR
jgi:membrane protein implicated in regulation of membrane protease activity